MNILCGPLERGGRLKYVRRSGEHVAWTNEARLGRKRRGERRTYGSYRNEYKSSSQVGVEVVIQHVDMALQEQYHVHIKES